MSDPSREAWQAWHAARERSVASVPGNLSCVAYQPIGAEAAPVEQVPGVSISLDPAGGGALVHVEADVALELDGDRVTGTARVGQLEPRGGPLLHAGRWWFDVFSLDGSDYELRVYDEQAANLARFAGIDAHPHDPAWTLPGTFTARDADELLPWAFTRAGDTGHTKRVPGTVGVDVGGVHYELLAFRDGPAPVLTVADATTGHETYAPGLFLRLDPPDGDGVVVDFNRAFIPPCGFSDAYSCPLPPAGNRIAAPVPAGEKRVLWR